ncbi:hypothetical protein J3L11_12600 [Shewanella sp. 4t3-1-2LB]|uniref:M1 family aminopeptidase n=1 Tax=Shewanella sp. 4t3-1-2LB TaxID=2817682 RepID=UPI001A98293F|nr:M1 family aminopeptidase [Shewanella sp. 4t3-1-2LB]MBO1272483.1 hypothetical protein [Shewanella sp. 4t3-1-2LB]
MIRTVLCNLFFIVIYSQVAYASNFSERQLQLVPTHYQMNYQINIKQEDINASAVITLQNISDKPATHIPLELYRLLHVDSVTDIAQTPLSFSQQVLVDETWPAMQTNYVEISLPEPLAPQKSYSVKVSFSGKILGYVETGMAYTQDSINEQFSIIRQDVYAYPIPLYPNDDVNRKAKWWLNHFDYDVTVEVPQGYIVANMGKLISTEQHKERVAYRYQNKLPAWRMDFAIAKYQKFYKGDVTLYSFEDKQFSEQLLNKSNQAVELYRKWFGELDSTSGYTMIEIPKGYGSQADRTGMLIVADGFIDHSQIYHEISHQWNVKANELQAPRWNEGLATFLQYFVAEKLDKPGVLAQETEKSLSYVKRLLTNKPLYSKTTFLDYGKHGLSAYEVGMLFFHLLYDITGEQDFNKIVGGYYHQYYQSGGTTLQFINYAKSHSHKDLTQLMQEWAFSSQYADRILASPNYNALLANYLHS